MANENISSRKNMNSTSNPTETTFRRRSESESDAIEYLNKILRGEISAVESYTKVIEAFPKDSQKYDLTKIMGEHQDNVTELKRLLRIEGEIPSKSSGAWGTTVSMLVNIASFVGDKSAVNILIEGEEHGLNQYVEALDLDLPPESKRAIVDKFIPQARMNITNLKSIVSEV